MQFYYHIVEHAIFYSLGINVAVISLHVYFKKKEPTDKDKDE